jgi:HK97 family phage prohead protease
MVVSPVNEWTEINSAWEGRFMERFAPGAWAKTIRDNSSDIRSLFQHGMDPQVGDKPLGPIRTLEETDRGLEAEVALLDTSYNRDLLPGLRAGLYGTSHRFRYMRQVEVKRPGVAPHNPSGLPERTVKEAQLKEFGPVTFPAYKGATAGIRSLTDDFLRRCAEEDPERLRKMLEGDEKRMDSEDVGTLADMLVCSNQYIEEQDEGSPAEAAAIVAMQGIQAELIKLMNVEAAEEEPSTSPKTNGPTRTTHPPPPTPRQAPRYRSAARARPVATGRWPFPSAPRGRGSHSPTRRRRPHGPSDDGRGTPGADHRDHRPPERTRRRVPRHDVLRGRQDRVRGARRRARRA